MKKPDERTFLIPFFSVGFLYLVGIALFLWSSAWISSEIPSGRSSPDFSGDNLSEFQKSFWLFFKFWGISLLDLLAIGKLSKILMSFSSQPGERSRGLFVNIFFWGTIKFSCLGFFIFLLMNSSYPEMKRGGIYGILTMTVLPLVLGFWHILSPFRGKADA